MSKRSMTRAVLREARRRKRIVFKRGRGTFYFDRVNAMKQEARNLDFSDALAWPHANPGQGVPYTSLWDAMRC